MAIPLMKVRTKLGLDDILGFGRHRGYTILTIVKDRPEYIKWLIDNTNLKFYESVHTEVYKYLCKPPVLKGNIYLDYDTDLLGEWDVDVPF